VADVITNTESMEWLTQGRADDEVVGPGLTMADWRAFLDRPPAPDGAAYRGPVPYTTDPRELKLFVYARADVGERRPMVLFIHGGGWQGLHPFVHIRHCAHLAALGYVTATTSYRLYPEATFPAMLDDCRAALSWLRANAHELGGDAARMAVAGGSAGGHLSALLALTDDVKAAVLWYPMTDMHAPGASPATLHDDIAKVLGEGGEEAIVAASPLTYVHRDAPPILTITGDLDELTPVAMIRDFHAALDAKGVPNRLDVFEGRGHAFDLLPEEWTTTTRLLVDWLQRHV
jgi:acetyl esterase